MSPEQTPQPNPLGELKRLRTYESDVAEILKKDKVSLSKIALAEDEKRRAEPPPVQRTPSPSLSPPPPKTISFSTELTEEEPNKISPTLLWIAGGIILASGVGVALWFLTKAPRLPVITEIPAPTERQSAGEVTLTGNETRAGAILAIRKAADALSIRLEEIKMLTMRVGGRLITTAELFERLGLHAPDTLIRALGSTPTIGLHGVRGVQLFLLFSVVSFEHGFDSMLRFEKTLLEDLGPLFGINPLNITKSASSTADYLENPPGFKDVIIKNKDARAVFDEQGQIIFLYSFLDKETLVITTNDETVKALASRVSRGKLR